MTAPMMKTCPEDMYFDYYTQECKRSAPAAPVEPPSRGYLNAAEGLSGIGRAMRDKRDADIAAMRPIDDGELERFRNPPPQETYKKGGRVKRKADMGHISHADHVKKHHAVGGFMHHSDHAKKLCGGGYMKGKK